MSFGANAQSSSPDPLQSWFQGGFAGKKIVVWGNSTVSHASQFFTELGNHAGPGQELEGLTVTPVVLNSQGLINNVGNIYNFGNNGARLADLFAPTSASGQPFPLPAVCAAHPDLLIIRGPLINDVRQGACDLACSTKLLQQALDTLEQCTPQTAILLTTENSLLTTDPGNYHWVSPAMVEAAQQYSTILHDAVMAMDGKYPNVKVYDVMSAEYGTVAPATSPYMLNQLHPGPSGRSKEANLLLKLIGKTVSTPSVDTTTPATLTSPAAGSQLGSSATFTWTPGSGVTDYSFYLGSTPGAHDVYYLPATPGVTSVTVPNIPQNGGMLFVRVYSQINGVWSHLEYTFIASGTAVPAALSSPSPGTPLNSSATFAWTPGSGVTYYSFYLGTSPGAHDVYYLPATPGVTSASVSSIPTNGETLYARVYSQIDGVWSHLDYTFAATGTPVPAVLTSPSNGSVLGKSATFTWSPGAGVTAYSFYLGTTPGAHDVAYVPGTPGVRSATATNIPQGGEALYARVYSQMNGVWSHLDYTFTAMGTPVPAALSSPADGSILGKSATFTWTPGLGVTYYSFYLGTTYGAHDIAYVPGQSGVTSASAVNIPQNGKALYARVYSQINGVWSHLDYTFSTETLGTKLRRLASTASSPLLAPPLLPVAAWAPSTAYKAGTVVSNSGSSYLCATAGTSGTSGPAGTGPGPIVDNTVTWYYYGPIATPSGSAPLFTQSFTPDPTLTKRVFVPDNASSFYFAGGTPTAIATPGWPGIAEYIFPAVTISSGRQANHFASVTFFTNAAKFAIEDGSGTMFRMIVDGQYVTPSGLPDNGNRGYKKLDFTNAGGGKTRKVIFLSGGGWAFNAVRVGASDSVWAPASTADNIRVAVVGDSITAGGGTFPLLLDENWPGIVGMDLGWNDVWNQAVGGTGYINTVNGTAYNFGQRISDVISSAPDVVIVFGGLNDSICPPSQVQSAALAYFQAIRAGLPNTPIIVLGVYPAATGPSSSIINTENAIHDAVTAFNDPLTYFVPIATDPSGSWLSGTGKVTSPNGTGNSDLYTSADGTHPTEAGLAYLGQRVTQALQIVVQRIP